MEFGRYYLVVTLYIISDWRQVTSKALITPWISDRSMIAGTL
jgi:hypothetical protein